MNVQPQLLKSLASHPWLLALVAWEMLWKGLAMWKSARRDEPLWFIAVFVLNTAGLLPMIYVVFFARRRPDLVSGV